MGGYFLCLKTPNLQSQEVDKKYRKSLEVFNKKGLTLDRRLVRDDFTIYRYQKILGPLDKVLELPNGDDSIRPHHSTPPLTRLTKMSSIRATNGS